MATWKLNHWHKQVWLFWWTVSCALLKAANPNHSLYSWDNCNEAVWASQNIYATYDVKNEGHSMGYFIINVTNGYVAQMESAEEDFEYLMAGIAQVCSEIRVNNVDATRTQRLENMIKCGLANSINQYEMVFEYF